MALERLQILVDGNAQGAIREFEKLGQAADRELGKTDDRLNRISASLTSFGTGLLAGGAVAIGGLKQLADSASAYGEQVSAATVTFGEEGAAQLEQFAEAASDTANISKTEATKAANSFATFARQAGLTGTAAVKFSTDLVQLAGDISSFRDISVEEALQSLQSGLAGEGEPIRRLGGDISDVALKAEYLAVTGKEVTGTLTQQQKVVAINSKLFKDFELAQGDVIRTGDSLANKTRNAEAEFENLKTELGEGLVPIFATVVGGIGGVIDKFRELPAAQQNTLATLGGFAAFGSVAVGALSLVAGQAIKFRDAFTTTTTTVVDGVESQRRSINRLGQAAIVAGKVVTTLAAVTGAFSLLNESSGKNREFADSINAVTIASKEGGQAILEAFANAAVAQDDIFNLRDVYEDQGTRIVLASDGMKLSIEDVQRTLDALSDVDPQIAAQYLDELEILTNGLDRNSRQYQKNREFIDQNRKSLNLSAEAANVTGGQFDQLSTEIDKLNEPAETATNKIQGLTVEITDNATAFEAYIDKLRASTDPFFAVISAANSLQDANRKSAEAFFALADGATTEELEAFADAQRNNVQAALDQEEAIATLRDMVEQGKIGYGDFVVAMNEIVQRNPELLGAVQQVKNEFFFAALAAQGLQNTAPIDLPVNAQTEQAVTQLQGVVAVLEAIATAAEAVRLAELFAEQVRAAENAQNRADIGFQEVVGNRDLNGNGVIGRRRGGPVNAGDLYMVGEAGPELFRPRTSGSIVPNNQLGGSVNITQNISSPDPLLTAAEVVRRQRDAEFLAGV
jgi:hypothetical protein